MDTRLNSSYEDALTLPGNRFGKAEILTTAYTRAILDIKAPSNDVHSLRRFHDKLETLLRGLRTLDNSASTNSSMFDLNIKRLYKNSDI